MDRQIFNIVSDIDGVCIITALNPVARDALITYHGKELISSLGLVGDLVLKEKDYPNTIKGKISEFF
jgi:hypothetical protein